MNNISMLADKTSLKRMIYYPKEYKDELFTEILKINIKREKILAVVLIAIDALLFLIHTYASKNMGEGLFFFGHFTYLHVLLFLVPVAFLFFSYLGERMEGDLVIFKVLHVLINILVLCICAWIAVNNESINKQPFAYVMAMYCIASIVFLSPAEGIFVYFTSYAFYVFGIMRVQTTPESQFEGIFFAALLTAVALIVSRVNYSSYVRNFISHKIIQGKNEEIDSMYREAEEALKKRTEELKETVEYEKLRTAFFANISHELRTPLNVIYSAEQMLDVILKRSQAQEKHEEIGTYMFIIKQNCFRLIRLIANLIDITKIDAGYFNVNLTNNDIVKVVEDITLSVAKYVEDRRVNLIFDTEIEEKVMACDPDKIERIMLNLLSNAIKFTSEGGSIFVNIYEGENKLIISVKDTGMGIPEEMRDSIFEKFVQVDKTTSRTTEGSGIGLSIVKSLVEMHNGSISLISEKGKGSEFIIEIPANTVLHSENGEGYNFDKEIQNVEKINIEFSDIYS